MVLTARKLDNPTRAAELRTVYDNLQNSIVTSLKSEGILSDDDIMTVSTALSLWYILWYDVCQTLNTPKPDRLLLRQTYMRWARTVSSEASIRDLFLTLDEVADEVISKTTPQAALRACCDSVWFTGLPLSAQVADVVLPYYAASYGIYNCIAIVRTIGNFMLRINIDGFASDGIQKWIDCEDRLSNFKKEDFDLKGLTSAAKPWLLGKPGSLTNYRLSSGSVSDVRGSYGQPGLRLGANALSSKKDYCTTCKNGLIWPYHRAIGEPTSKLITVPKSWKTRRVIVMDPSYQAWLQKNIEMNLSKAVKGRWGNSCDPRDPAWNRNHVSDSNEYATIDLSMASDSVSLPVMEAVFPPEWRRLLLSARSSQVEMPDGQKHKLIKYAGMGNSTTFPTEVHVFRSIVEYARISGGFPKEAAGVFGDDILVPCEWYDSVITSLQHFGFMPNEAKSWSQPFLFRESCGFDYYADKQCNPLRLPRKFAGIACYLQAPEAKSLRVRKTKESLTGLTTLQNTVFLAFGQSSLFRLLSDFIRELGGKFSELIWGDEDLKPTNFEKLYGSDTSKLHVVFKTAYSPTADACLSLTHSFPSVKHRLRKPVNTVDRITWRLIAPYVKVCDEFPGIDLWEQIVPWNESKLCSNSSGHTGGEISETEALKTDWLRNLLRSDSSLA